MKNLMTYATRVGGLILSMCILSLVSSCGGAYGKAVLAAKANYEKDASKTNILIYARALHDELPNLGLADQTIAIFKDTLMKKHPDTKELISYYGSILTKTARLFAEKGDLVKATERLSEGFDLLDRNVAENPDNYQIRLVRAVNSLGVPKEYGRMPVGGEDFDWLEKNTDKIERNALAMFYSNYALYLKNNGDQEKSNMYLEKLKNEFPDFKQS